MTRTTWLAIAIGLALAPLMVWLLAKVTPYV